MGCLVLIVGLAVAVTCVVCMKKNKRLKQPAASREDIIPNTDQYVISVPNDCGTLHVYDEVGPSWLPVGKADDVVMTIEPCVAYGDIGTESNVAYSTSSVAADNILQCKVT